MIKECPICHKAFDALNDQKVYCNVLCRKRACHEKEKEQRSQFYAGPSQEDNRVLCTLTQPTLERVQEIAVLLEHFTRATKIERAVMIYGTFPEGWMQNSVIEIWPTWGAKPPSWTMCCKLPVEKPLEMTGGLLKKPLPHQRAEVTQAVIGLDEAAEQALEQAERQEPSLGGLFK